MKKILCGLIVGLLMATCLVTYAGDYILTPNPFPILVNGIKQDIEAYNINGYTFLKLSQVGMATNSVVEFNTEKQQIEITTDFLKPEMPTEPAIIGRLESKTEGIKMFNVNGLETDKVVLNSSGIVYLGARELAMASSLGLGAKDSAILLFPDKESLSKFDSEKLIGEYNASSYSDTSTDPVVIKDDYTYISLNFLKDQGILDYQLQEESLSISIN